MAQAQPQTQVDLERILKGPNAYQVNPRTNQMEYVTVTGVDTEYPRAMFRKASAEEIQNRRDNYPKDVWLDRDTDLIQLTGFNHPQKVEAWESFCTRPVEKIVANAKEEKALGPEWTRNLKDAFVK